MHVIQNQPMKHLWSSNASRLHRRLRKSRLYTIYGIIHSWRLCALHWAIWETNRRAVHCCMAQTMSTYHAYTRDFAPYTQQYFRDTDETYVAPYAVPNKKKLIPWIRIWANRTISRYVRDDFATYDSAYASQYESDYTAHMSSSYQIDYSNYTLITSSNYELP